MKRKRSNCIPRKTLILVAILGGVFLNTALSWLAGSQLPPIESFTDASERTAKQPKDGRRKARQVMPPRKSSHNTIGFVHIGKTGGSTLSTLLRNGCTSFVKLPCHNITNESTVSKLVVRIYSQCLLRDLIWQPSKNSPPRRLLPLGTLLPRSGFSSSPINKSRIFHSNCP